MNDDKTNMNWDETIAMGKDPTSLSEIQQQAIQDHSPNIGRVRERLMKNYIQLLSDKAIFFPVAYTLHDELGQGRQGTVFEGSRQGGRGCLTHHAIKVFDPGIYRNAKLYWTDMGRIAEQVSALQPIRSPHLVGLDTYDEVNGVGYVQMEHVVGYDLRKLLKPWHLEKVRKICEPDEWSVYESSLFKFDDRSFCFQPGVAIYMLRMMLKGIETLHDVGFVHSDLKPANIMINRLGYVKLVDFGRAVKLNERPSMLFGTPLYMAPEIHEHQAATIQSDLFSVGLIGLEILTGSLPFNAQGSTEELMAEKRQLANRLEEFLPDYILVNEEFVSVLRRFIQPDPKDRPSSALEAESEEAGLRLVHKQLALMGQDADYSRLMGMYMDRLVSSTLETSEPWMYHL